VKSALQKIKSTDLPVFNASRYFVRLACCGVALLRLLYSGSALPDDALQ
jgi:hypothetical protein